MLPLLFLLAADPLWTAKPLTAPHQFTKEIEGPAVDRNGNIYAVSFQRTPTIGKVTPDGTASLWIEMPDGSLGNGIRFDRKGMMFVADYSGHNVLRIDPATKQVSVFAHNASMNQPNDLAIAPDETLYASDPNWQNGTGQIWHIDHKGQIKKVAGDMGTTNGIEVSPDGKRLYVNESVQRKIWVFDIQPDHTLQNKRLLIEFPDFGFDGMRCDSKENLYVTRHGKGTVAVVSQQGQVLREIDVLGKKPTNLTFGGPDGKTVYVTEVEHGRLVSFRTDLPGREFIEAAKDRSNGNPGATPRR
ncbi:SMP-30/gluconolactonase/LRE family protein [Bryobacter aggregatus]|uniref:SMP-30/gluconolactonase/LRE family protein n=1 Tax=Bryobacter aggregatus TaxID=360054 RepID=UPI00068A7510|nr:SMP-30/gluconolactonase/LRE family protein [Bryobacter aggregatus]